MRSDAESRSHRLLRYTRWMLSSRAEWVHDNMPPGARNTRAPHKIVAMGWVANDLGNAKDRDVGRAAERNPSRIDLSLSDPPVKQGCESTQGPKTWKT